MNAGAAIVERDETFVAAVRREQRRRDWCLHELRDMGKLSRDLVETGERLGALHLALEPRAKCAMFNDDVRAGARFDAAHVAQFSRAKQAQALQELYDAVAARIGAGDISLFAMAFAAQRPSIGELKQVCRRSFAEVAGVIENGLLAIWSFQQVKGELIAVNDLERI